MDGGTRTGTVGAPVVGWAEGPLGAVQAAAREMSRQAALRVRAVAAFAATRPASTDRQQGERGATSAERWAARPEVLRPVSEWAAQELSIALNITTQAAEAELARSLTPQQRLPRVLDALQAGLLHDKHLWPLLEHVAPIADVALRAKVERELLDWIAARGRVTTPAALGDRVRRVVARHDARNAARDLARALAQRGISLRPERTAGMSAVTVVCSTPEAHALYRALGAYVDALEAAPGDERTRGQRLVDCLLDLVLRPGEHELPPVQALLTIVASVHTALGGDAAGEVDGALVPAEMARQLARAFAGPPPIPGEESPATDDAGAADEDAAPDGTPATAGSAARGDTAARGGDADPATAAGGALSHDADAASAATPLAGNALEPVDVRGGPVDRAAAALRGADFDRWLDELVRDAFGDDPAPAPGDPGWAPGEPPGWDAGSWDDPCAWLDARARARDRGPDLDLGLDDDLDQAVEGDGCVSASGAGWWAAADRAVDQAGAAVHAADEAAWQAGAAGRVTAAEDALAALAAATDAQRAELAALLEMTAGGGLADRPPDRGHRRGHRRPAGADRRARPAPDRALRAPGVPAPAGILRPRPDRPPRPAHLRPHPGLPARGGPEPVRPGPRPALPLSRLPPPRAQRR